MARIIIRTETDYHPGYLRVPIKHRMATHLAGTSIYTDVYVEVGITEELPALEDPE